MLILFQYLIFLLLLAAWSVQCAKTEDEIVDVQNSNYVNEHKRGKQRNPQKTGNAPSDDAILVSPPALTDYEHLVNLPSPPPYLHNFEPPASTLPPPCELIQDYGPPTILTDNEPPVYGPQPAPPGYVESLPDNEPLDHKSQPALPEYPKSLSENELSVYGPQRTPPGYLKPLTNRDKPLDYKVQVDQKFLPDKTPLDKEFLPEIFEDPKSLAENGPPALESHRPAPPEYIEPLPDKEPLDYKSQPVLPEYPKLPKNKPPVYGPQPARPRYSKPLTNRDEPLDYKSQVDRKFLPDKTPLDNEFRPELFEDPKSLPENGPPNLGSHQPAPPEYIESLPDSETLNYKSQPVQPEYPKLPKNKPPVFGLQPAPPGYSKSLADKKLLNNEFQPELLEDPKSLSENRPPV